MMSTATIAVCLCLISSALAMPSRPVFLGYQDSIGQYSFGYSDPMSARSEYRASDGVTRGVYSYIDNQGLIQTAEYEAGQDLGFRVKASNLPIAPLPIQDTAEVLAAREKHLQLLDQAKMREENDRSMKNEQQSPFLLTRIAEQEPMMKDEKMMPKINDEKMKSGEMPMLKEKDDMKKDMLKMEEKPMMTLPRFSLLEHALYTPEVEAAREAHFRAYETAANLAIESDRNPFLLEHLLRNPNPVPMPLKEEKMEDKMNMLETKKAMDMKMSEDSKMAMEKSDMKVEIGSRLSEMKEDMPETKKMESEKSAPGVLTKMVEKSDMGSGTVLTYNTDLKVKDFEELKPFGDQRLLITKTMEFAPTWNLPLNAVPGSFPVQPKNWGFQYMYI